jgi:gliding motility-associated-like protein
VLFRKILLSIFFWCIGQYSQAQLIPIGSTNACSCDGQVTVINSTGNNITYHLVSFAHNYDQQQTSPGDALFIGLCPGFYILEQNDQGNLSTNSFIIEDNSNAVQTLSNADYCNTNATVDLNEWPAALPIGGTWFDPLGNPVAAVIPIGQAANGAYTYVYNNGCVTSNGLQLSIQQAPNTGNQTTTLICDTWAPFNMLIYMQGAPDPGGQWYTSQGVPMDGTFNPATMNSQLFTYIINDVPGCAPAYTTMYIQENITPNPGMSDTLLLCTSGAPFSMFGQLNGNPSAGGTWTNPLNQSVPNVLNPSTAIEGVYTYHLDALTPCVDQEVELTINLTTTDPSGLPSTLDLCNNAPGFNMQNALNGSPLTGGIWTDSANQAVSNNFTWLTHGAGTYHYYYPNVGCTPQGATLTITSEILGEAGNNYTGTICSNAGTLNLDALRSIGSTSTGIWYNTANQIINPIIQLDETAQQQYTYFIDGTHCPDDFAYFNIFVDLPPPSLPNYDTTICTSSEPTPIGTIFQIPMNAIITDVAGNSMSSNFDPAASEPFYGMVTLLSGNTCPDEQSDLQILLEAPLGLAVENALICDNSEIIDLTEIAPAFVGYSGNWFDQNNSPVGNISNWNSTLTDYYFIPNSLLACPLDTGHLHLNVSTFQESIVSTPLNICSLSNPLNLANYIAPTWPNIGVWQLENTPLASTYLDPSVGLSGDYIYTIPGIGACPEATQTLPIQFIGPPSYNLGPDLTYCANVQNIQLGSQNGSYSFTWTPTNYLNDPTSSSPILNSNPSADQVTILQYVVEVSNSVCTIYDSLSITYNPLPVIPVDSLYELCLGEQLTINLPLGANYTWAPALSFANPNAASQSFEPLSDANFTITAENIWGCEQDQTFDIDVHINPSFEVVHEPTSACYSITDTLSAIGFGNYIYEWQWGSESFLGNPLIIALNEPNIYNMTILATDSIGCQTHIDLGAIYELYPSPNAAFYYEPEVITTVNNSAYMVNQTNDATQFIWTLSDGQTSDAYAPTFEFSGTEPNNYTICLEVINTQGCSDTTCRILHMDNEYLLFAPNTFTPDNDQINDAFSISLLGFDMDSYSLRIFDRWGLEVFTTTDPMAVWTGDILGGSHYGHSDTYLWVVQVKDLETADYRIFKGHVTLIR